MTSPLRPIMGIVLSGLPCTGKSTWSDRFTAKSHLKGWKVKVISSDTISYKICDEYNEKNVNKLNYTTVWNDHRQEIENQYKSEISKAIKDRAADIVIFDRTHTTLTTRSKALQLAQEIETIYLLSLKILDENAWHEKLKVRNEMSPNKTITPEIIAYLKNGASAPEQSEGFASIFSCSAIGEADWDKGFDDSVEQLLEAYQKLSSSN